jgi:hypothetical protein
MKKLMVAFVLLSLLAGNVEADVMLDTSNPSSNPLIMGPGTTSGSMFVNVTSNNYPNDIMAAWQFTLTIVPIGGATGTLTFQDPGPANGTTLYPSNPSNYVFSNSYGIFATNSGSQLSANDFDVNLGTVVPASGANLLQMDFLASSNASGSFGIYAVEGITNTLWTDSNANTQYYSNVPDGTGTVLIGQVNVTTAVVPEPPLGLLLAQALACLALYGYYRRYRYSPKVA